MAAKVPSSAIPRRDSKEPRSKSVWPTTNSWITSTKKALLVIDVQNDSLHKDGMYLDKDRDIVRRLKNLIPVLRHDTRIIWTCNYLKKGILYQEGSKGALIHDELQPLMDAKSDLIVLKKHDSAFEATSLLTALRKEMMTDIYISGYLTDTAIWSTAVDAVKHGYRLHLIEDCLGYMEEEEHRKALNDMINELGADIVSSKDLCPQRPTLNQHFEKLDLDTDEDTMVTGSKNTNSIVSL